MDDFVEFDSNIASCTDTAAQQWQAKNAGKSRKTVPEGQTIVKQLGKQQINSLFTHLRKIAQHPLLVRNLCQRCPGAESCQTCSSKASNILFKRACIAIVSQSRLQKDMETL